MAKSNELSLVSANERANDSSCTQHSFFYWVGDKIASSSKLRWHICSQSWARRTRLRSGCASLLDMDLTFGLSPAAFASYDHKNKSNNRPLSVFVNFFRCNNCEDNENNGPFSPSRAHSRPVAAVVRHLLMPLQKRASGTRKQRCLISMTRGRCVPIGLRRENKDAAKACRRYVQMWQTTWDSTEQRLCKRKPFYTFGTWSCLKCCESGPKERAAMIRKHIGAEQLLFYSEYCWC